MTDADVLFELSVAFGTCERPEHFTDVRHCCDQCAEHDERLRSRDRISLRIEDVGNPGWDPLCFTSAEGLLYYMPALGRLALDEPTRGLDWCRPCPSRQGRRNGLSGCLPGLTADKLSFEDKPAAETVRRGVTLRMRNRRAHEFQLKSLILAQPDRWRRG